MQNTWLIFNRFFFLKLPFVGTVIKVLSWDAMDIKAATVSVVKVVKLWHYQQQKITLGH